MSEPAKTTRVFFALWPDPKVQSALDLAARQLHAKCGGRQTRLETIHITLVFLGEVELEKLKTLQAVAGEVRAQGFEWSLAKFGWWRHNRIAWAGPDAIPPALTQLVEQLQSGLKQAGFEFDQRPYSPHATLLRKADCRHVELVGEAIPWKVSEFVLVRSVLDEKGAAYEIIGRWLLS